MNPFLDRWIPRFFFASGFCLLGIASYSYFAFPPSSLLEVAATDLQIPGCVAGEKHEVIWQLHNRSGQPMRVLGLVTC